MSSAEQVAAELGFPVVSLPDSPGRTKDSAIRHLVNELIEGGFLPTDSADEIVTKVLKRESRGPTALGQGIALPHVTSPVVDRVVGILATSSTPVPWDALDGQPVTAICLILAPIDRPRDYLLALEKIARAIGRS